jgi:predicted aspartyl protease
MRRRWGAIAAGAAVLAAGLTPPGASVAADPPVPVIPVPVTPAPIAPATTAPDSPPQDLKLAFDRTARLILAVMVDGQGPFDFIVDTGSDRTVISRELADQLGLPPGPAVKMHEPAGVDRVQTVMIERLTVGDRVVGRIAAPVVMAANLGAAGILGVDSLKNLHLVVDFSTMRLSTSPSHEEPAAPGTVVVYGRSRFGQLILADAKIRGTQVFVVVDTGSDVSVGNPALLSLLTAGQAARAIGQVRLVSVTGRFTIADLDLIPQADIGNLRVSNMPLAFAQDHIFDHLHLVKEPAILLGMDVLRLCRRMTLDIRKRQASFTAPEAP